MNVDRAKILEILAQCRADQEALSRSASEISSLRDRAPHPAQGSPEVILYGYYLHQWYCTAENLLLRIASHFGNEIRETEWHKSLLERLKLNVPGLRPPVLSQESFENLQALRGFRHVFRHAYDYVLQWDLMQPNVELLPKAHEVFTKDVDRFLEYLQSLADQV